MSGAGHRDDASHVRLRVELSFDLVARTARTGHARLTFTCIRAATLNHETLDDAVEGRAVVELLVREFFEDFDRLGGDIAPESESHFTVRRFDDSVFRGGFGSTHGRRSEPPPPDSRKNENPERELRFRRLLDQRIRFLRHSRLLIAVKTIHAGAV